MYNNNYFLLGIFLLSMLLPVSTNAAKMYIWTDENGKKVFSQKPPTDSSTKTRTKEYRGGGVNSMVLENYMRKPVNGRCKKFFTIIEGICVHATAMKSDALKMKEAIRNFKSGKKSSKKSYNVDRDNIPVASGNEEARDKARCERWRKRLAKYEREGVQGVDFNTRNIQKMNSEQASDAMNGLRENISLFCN